MEPNVAQILEHRARLTPNRVGVVEWESARRFRFSELEERACRLAAWLSYFGVKKGERVSIIALNGVYYVDLFFALAKLGAIFTPINWRLAVPEMEYILKDAQPKAIFYEEDFSPQVRELRAFYPNAEWISLSNYEERLFSFPPEAPEVKVGLEDPHTIFYTSGTTGRPKGAILPHRMILWNSVNTIVSWGAHV
jgi:fatty-acyl-CoA synthase